VPSHLTRRNITISDGAVPSQPGTRLRIGEVLLDDTIGAGAQEALRTRVGTVYRVLEGGEIAVGDEVRSA
jgi:MOSC domain-containing protein YiiM